MTATTIQIVATIRELQLLTEAQCEQLSAKAGDPSVDVRSLGKELVTLGWLTPFQVNRLVQNRASELCLGHHLLLEQLGEGGMGTVYKARHRRMNRVVALKVIRKQKLDNEDSVKRFQREIEAVGRLQHPNVVIAFDADEVNGTHFFAMEYVEGMNLAELVRKQGPLGVSVACDLVRQAALGLQHAHEHGLVHRDIKPSNLLFSKRDNLVKVLDLGLARFHQDEGQANSAITQAGMVMGTPDFMAPEQATNPHQVDVRADIYSLGATLCFLLLGKPPFPGGTLEQKLSWHIHAQPPALDKAREDVPPGLNALVQKMLAKQPSDRFATPAEVAAALAPYCSHVEALSAPTVSMSQVPISTASRAQDVPTVYPVADTESATAPPLPERRPLHRRKESLIAASIGGAILLVILLVKLFPGPDLTKKGVAAGPTPPPVLIDDKPRIQYDFGPGMQVGLWALDERGDAHSLTYNAWGALKGTFTTNTVSKLDNREYEFGYTRDGIWEQKLADLGPDAQGKARLGKKSIFRISDFIRITQELEIAPSRTTVAKDSKQWNVLDTCAVRYRIENLDQAAHDVGIRCYIDTVMGDNDRPFFVLPSDQQKVRDPLELRGGLIPPYVKMTERDDAFNPGLVGYFTLKIGGVTPFPDRFTIVGRGARTWEIPVESSPSLKDAGVVLYWEPRTVRPGETLVVGYGHGLGILLDIDPALDLQVRDLFRPSKQ